MPVLSPLTALIALPEYLLNGLSTVVFQRSIAFHYVAAEVPFLYAAAVLGIARLHRWLVRRAGAERGERVASAATRTGTASARSGGGPRSASKVSRWSSLLVSLAANYLMGPLPFSLPGAKYSGQAPTACRATRRRSPEPCDMIPRGVTVSAENDAGSQLSDRRVIYVFPYMDEAKYIVVDDRKPFWFDKPNAALHSPGAGAARAQPGLPVGLRA